MITKQNSIAGTIAKNRRELLQQLGLLFTAAAIAPTYVFAQSTQELKSLLKQTSNFHAIYDNKKLSSNFLLFLKNVFHLYPEQELQLLIIEQVKRIKADKDIYITVQNKLESIAPFLVDLRFSLPALKKQKNEMRVQTTQLLGNRTHFNTYLELGTTGRYLDILEESMQIGDERYFIAERDANYSPTDIVDRGQIPLAGVFTSMNNYQPNLNTLTSKNSIDLMTVYIGFHHCPISLRNEFISNLRELISPKGSLILRDHNVTSLDMWHMVSLAHDVFNMGTMETWNYNFAELRNFYSLNYLQKLMLENGFKTDGRRLFQTGDPTHNALMLYTKA